MSRTWVTNLVFAPAPRADTEHGLLGWVSFDINGTWHVDCVALRRTQQGRLALSFPSKLDARGFEHPFLRPTCDRARRVIERAVLGELGLLPSETPPRRASWPSQCTSGRREPENSETKPHTQRQ